MEDVIPVRVTLTRVLLLLLALALVASCQVNDATHLGGAATLNTWRVQAGDDPRWAAPGFDDSAWRVFPADKP